MFVSGTDASARSICILAGVAMSEARTNYEEKHNKATFVKNIISDNILPGDVYVRAKELHFVTDVPRAVFLIRQVERTDVAVLEVIQNLFQDRQRDFVLSVSEADVVVIKELTNEDHPDEVNKIAETIQNTVRSELGVKTVIGIGSPAYHLRELADRYKEAQVAIEVGKVFDTEKTIINYENPRHRAHHLPAAYHALRDVSSPKSLRRTPSRPWTLTRWTPSTSSSRTT